MRAYADSSFIARLMLVETDSPAAIALYRRANRPALFYTPFHAVEVPNALFRHAFEERALLPKSQAAVAERRRDAAFARLKAYLDRQLFLRTDMDIDAALEKAGELAAIHTEKLGVRALDLIHVACAVELETETFITTDAKQSSLAKAVGFRVMMP